MMDGPLTPEIRAVLERHVMWNTYLFAHGRNGVPAGFPMLAAFERDALEFTTYRAAAKAKLLMADPRTCCVVRSPVGEEAMAVALWGSVAEVEGDDHYLSRADGEPGPIAVPAAMRTSVQDRLERGTRMVFRMPIERARMLLVPSTGEGRRGTL
jgi:hypothetical protein